jgi:hypothetical protein
MIMTVVTKTWLVVMEAYIQFDEFAMTDGVEDAVTSGLMVSAENL